MTLKSSLHEERAATIPPLLGKLIQVAVDALYDEDRDLKKALQSAPSGTPNRSHGLSYWVFETTIVYEIFKAWLPVVDVEWECGYEGNVGQKADLVVFENERASLLFEAKWWPDQSVKTLDALRADIAKMRRWSQIDHRYLMTFWFSPTKQPDQWERDLKQVRSFCEDEGRLELIYATAFATDQVQTRGEGGSYFAFCIVSATQ